MTNALFQSSNMNGADLSRAIMPGADFTLAMIRDSMWIATDVRGASFNQASLHRSDFTLAKWDDTTNFPEKFDPENTGPKDVND
jgi:uncharacterized protein YjbI with pentapeptide repeats